MKCKRYVWMAGYTYYASGGFHDYHGSFDIKEEAEAAQSDWLRDKEYVWSHICDLETNEFTGIGQGCNPMGFLQS